MNLPPTRVLACGAAPWLNAPRSSLVVDRCASLDEALDSVLHAPPEAIVVDLTAAVAQHLLGTAAWRPVLNDIAVLLVMPPGDEALALRLVTSGVQDVLSPSEAASPAIEQRIRFAVARKQLERDARKAWSTDLDTGLPNRDQLLEHLNQLLALRVRQPAPMALLVLRIDGLDQVVASHGPEGAQLVRRKVAVRLRGAVRASDVVASLGGDAYALLLARIEAPADAHRVALKLARVLREPFNVLGAAVGIHAHIGTALHPADGREAEPLLRLASANALAAQRRKGAAAND
jgi:diguanylate cyclase (GGDEF)-like protein